MTPSDLAARLEHYAGKVREIRGVSRRNPHVFVEDKSELAGEMMAEARELRSAVGIPAQRPTIRPGIRTIGRREVRVETRRRA